MSTHRPAWFDPAIPAREDCVLPCLIDKWAARTPDKEFILFESGARWTWAQARDIARGTAAALQARGLKAGDTLLAWLPTGETLMRTWFAANYLGAILVPLNPSYRGRILEHAVSLSDARLMVAHPNLAERLAMIDRGRLDHVILDSAATEGTGLDCTLEPVSALDGDATALVEDYQPQIWDTQMIIFTSGTTGPSKGVINAYFQLWTTGQGSYGYMTAEDRMLINLPMYHVGGTSSMMAVLASGGSAALFEAFSTHHFWDQMRRTGATTISGLIGAMTAFLGKLDPSPDDRDNALRICTLMPLTEATFALARRHGFDYVSGFNMTELSTPLVTDVNEPVHQSCGRPRSGIECRLVDDNDFEVPTGQTGELVVRSSRPWDITKGYYKNPEATAQAWRNGWFHTGDLMRKDAEGNYFFVDRKKDAIRRRGENISSIEVEADVAAYPDVQEVAAFGVASTDGEEEVMVVVAPRPGKSVDPAALIAFLVPRMPHYMVPRYVRVAQELPKTTTNKIQKVALRAEGVTADSWDREAAGIRLKREKLGGQD